MSHYSWYNLSTYAQHGTSLAFSFVGYLAESFVFVYLGFAGMHYKDS